MVIRWRLWIMVTSVSLLLTACGAEPSSQSEPISYKDMKSMVIDILKTEDAQKALQESASAQSGNSGFSSKLLSVQDQEQVRMAVKEVLVSPEYDKVINKLMTDPRFAGEFAKTVNAQNKQIHKDLLKDPTYQKDLIQVLKTPEMDKMILEVLQSSQYRKQVMSLMQDSMQNPLFRLELLELLKKAVQEELKPKPDEPVDKKKDEGSEESESGGDSSKDSESGGEGDSGDSSV
ncbi:spore germination lipoprotein GerD [Paenibacillus sp. MMS18-CY102]|uniref:spore germination lipoprotein GerD n=1 Tax=Paenibacillus sp. MMS18-CY102 TaxID=2682849 RepID=UPI0013661C8B|nr:spore germination lipoprotein GerD [Paenibacillus sp. MMS18-CY102]MWC28249.1 spore gernimation protein [Paenibacillus sp. MMS18-CY102]